ncbi:MAG: hypothetical protein ACPGIC_05775 [Opitutales bacterium]
MNKVSKVVYLCAILVLAWLAAMPHWPSIQEEAGHIYATWQQIRGAHPSRDAETEPAADQPEADRRERTLIGPGASNEALTMSASTSGTDPFIEEARRRAQVDPEATMTWLQEQNTGSERLRGMLEVVALWAAEDSESALLWLESNAQGLARLETLNSGVELWAARDPLATADWIDGMANDGSKIVAADSLAANWAKRDPDATAQWIEALPNGEIRDSAALSLIESWAEQDPIAASTWAAGQALQSGDDALLQYSMRAYALEDPIGAETFARSIARTENSPHATTAYVNARAEIDPAGTVNWLSSLQPNDPIVQSGYVQNYTQSALFKWTETDSIAASAWLGEQAAGPSRDAAITGFAQSIQRFEPEAAVAWANTISDPGRRAEQLTHSIANWAERDPRAALDWVIHADLEPTLQEQLARDIGID